MYTHTYINTYIYIHTYVYLLQLSEKLPTLVTGKFLSSRKDAKVGCEGRK